jgi:hypothetical protein
MPPLFPIAFTDNHAKRVIEESFRNEARKTRIRSGSFFWS